jgi:hypothetical protein
MFEQQWIDSFWKRVDKTSNPKGCWEWLGGKHSQGYGMFTFYPNKVRKTMTTHRFSAIIHQLDMSNGPLLRHLCNNTICCNPDHLKSGTQKDNMKDMYDSGRNKSKRRHHSIDTINEILEEYSKGNITQLELSKKYGMTSSYMSLLIKRHKNKIDS